MVGIKLKKCASRSISNLTEYSYVVREKNYWTGTISRRNDVCD